VVRQDEREQGGLRAILNYGHTFAHALESATRYESLLHGEAVAIGMLCASRLAESLQLIDSSVTQRQRSLLLALGLPVNVPTVDLDRVLEAMHQDKKVAHGKLRFVLPVALGQVRLVGDVDPQLVRTAVEG
jgi:3-dehydroquinate synthase